LASTAAFFRLISSSPAAASAPPLAGADAGADAAALDSAATFEPVIVLVRGGVATDRTCSSSAVNVRVYQSGSAPLLIKNSSSAAIGALAGAGAAAAEAALPSDPGSTLGAAGDAAWARELVRAVRKRSQRAAVT
jgi:hypothetical protein